MSDSFGANTTSSTRENIGTKFPTVLQAAGDGVKESTVGNGGRNIGGLSLKIAGARMSVIDECFNNSKGPLS